MISDARRIVGGLLVVALGAVLAHRIRTVASEPRIALSARVVQLMYNRMVAERIVDYARTHRRPPFYFDSVLAHLDSAEARRVAGLRIDLWGRRTRYDWSWCGFSITSSAGGDRRPALSPMAFQQDWRERLRHGRMAAMSDVWEQYLWPPGVGRSWDCGGGPVARYSAR